MMIAKILALTIFIVMFVLIITDKIEKCLVTLCCGLATAVLVFGLSMHSMSAFTETLNVRSIFTLGFWYEAGSSSESTSGVNWATIIFLAGMMVMVEGMAKAGFFRWLCMTIAIILSEIFCANLGGSATMCGDPPNIIIGTSLGYSFADFVTNTGLIAVISLVVIVAYFYLCFRKELGKAGTDVDISKMPSPKSAITDKKAFAISTVIFLIAVALLITHAQTGLTVAFIGTFIAIITLATSGKNAKAILKGVDYKTLLFFIGLFFVVGGLEQTGILEIFAQFIGKVSGGNIMVMIAIIIWVSAVASAFIDNIPFAATMIPVIKTLSATTGVDLSVLAWTLAMGTDIGGSATPIGASANVVGTSIASREGYPVTWGKYCKVAVPATIIVILISMLSIYVRYL